MDADQLLVTIARRNDGLLLRRDVSEAGITPGQWQRRVARGDWVPVCVDVWRHALVEDTWQLRARAGLLYLGDDAALFGGTAAAWWGLDVPDPSVAEFVVPRTRRRFENDLAVHTTEQWHRGDLLRRDGVRLTTVTRTVIDLAGTGCSAASIENTIDSGIRLRLTSVPTLVRRIDELAGSGRYGAPLLRALLLDSGGESYLERKFLALLRAHRLPRPTCQVVHREASDGKVRRVDFEFPGTNVIVEVSGRLGHVSDRERQNDARRRNSLQRSGFVVLEFTTADVLDDAPYVLTTLYPLVSRSQHA